MPQMDKIGSLSGVDRSSAKERDGGNASLSQFRFLNHAPVLMLK